MKNNIPSSLRYNVLALLFILLGIPAAVFAASDKYEKWDTAHDNGWSYKVKLGFVLGGTTPIPFPASIRSIDGFSTYGSTMLGFETTRNVVGNRLGITSGVRLTLEGMSTEARVKNYHMSLVQGGEKMEGFYTGINKSHERMLTVTVPVLASYRVCPRWTLKCGPYFQWLLYRKFTGRVYDGYLREGDPTGQKIAFTKENPATYDFSNDMRRFLWGAEVGADWQATNRLSAFTYLDFGINGVFHGGFKTIDFTMYPVFLTLGLACSL